MKQNKKWMLVAIALLALVALPLVGCKHEADSGVKAPEGFVYVKRGTVEGDTPPWLGTDPKDTEKGVFVKDRIVTLSDFYIGRHEVTQAEWKAVMTDNKNGIPTNPSLHLGDNLPVERVSWHEAVVYCNKRSIKEGLNPCYTKEGKTNPDDWGDTVPQQGYSAPWDTIKCDLDAGGYRLPTEAEWEYAARGGNPSNTTEWNKKYAGSNTIGDVAWYDNDKDKTHQVGTKAANSLGIYDMSGNVHEWCWDLYGSDPTAGDGVESPVTDPTGPSSVAVPRRVYRGGSWKYGDDYCRVSSRGGGDPYVRVDYIGFRVVRGL